MKQISETEIIRVLEEIVNDAALGDSILKPSLLIKAEKILGAFVETSRNHEHVYVEGGDRCYKCGVLKRRY